MRRLFAIALGLLILAGSAEPAPARAIGVGPFDDVWVARSGEAYPGSGSSCARPHAVADGVDDQSELNWAVQHLNDYGTLHLCAGTFHLTNPIGRLVPCAPGCYFALPTHLTISGAGMHKTILDGGATYSDGVRTGPGSDIIWAFTDEEELTLSDLTVQNAVEPDGNGAAVSSSAAVEIIRARFYRNETADEDFNLSGAAIDAPSIMIIDSIFAENTADGDGGAISSMHVEVSGSLFLDNSANGDGGAIDAASVVVTNSRFSGNDAETGGAIKAATLTVTGSTFSNNEGVCVGGAISVDDDVTVNSSTFTGNVSGCEGGAIYADDDVTVSSSVFTRNVADDYGGAIDLYGDLVVSGSIFTGNESGDGGAIQASSVSTISRSTFTNNLANNGNGGAIKANNLLVTASTFRGNDADYSGGAINSETVTIVGSQFTRNTAVERGGAVYVGQASSESFLQLRRNTFAGNRAASGGAITFRSCDAIMRSEADRVERANRFSGNRATEQRRTNNIELWEGDCFG